MLGRKASEHIAKVTACAKEAIDVYKTKYMSAEALTAMQTQLKERFMAMLKEKIEEGNDLVAAGDALLADKLMAVNSLREDYQTQDPDYKEGAVDMEKLAAALAPYLDPK